MKKVKLYTANGKIVTEIKMPLIMIRKGTMICWGKRYFYWNESEQIFSEGFLYIEIVK